ncbi:MAG TPA: DUF6786 family protein [Polyangiaceae bacterium]|nr:DUF6786 family protein [Polyangiaceae bacterium]
MTRPTFDEDVAFMRRYARVDVLTSSDGRCVATCPTWQGRVMTSAVAADGESLGFVNRPFIEAGSTGTRFDNYGGEDRFWLGPEGGQFGLFFAPGAPFEYESWRVPGELQQGAWSARAAGDGAVVFARTMRLENYARARFDVAVERRVVLLDARGVEARFGTAPPGDGGWVAFETVNVIANAGSRTWTRDTGLLSVWILGQYPAWPDARVLVPLSRGDGGAGGVNDRYFGKVPPDRLKLRDGGRCLVFTADGEHRSKIGVGPSRAEPVLGAYAPGARRLTLVRYSKPEGRREYVNSMWERQEDPYGGDVVNSYNDGPIGPGAPAAAAAFYELETSSAAAALAPGESLAHSSATLHVVGEPAVLEPFMRRALRLAP